MLNIWSESRINEQFILSTWKVWTRYSSQLEEQTLPRGKKKLSRIVKYWWDKMERNMINKKCRRRCIEHRCYFHHLRQRTVWFIERHARDETMTWKSFRGNLLSIRKENIGKESGPDGPVQRENFSRYVNALSDLVRRG